MKSMLYINYQISTIFFDEHIEVEQKSAQAIGFQEINQTLKALVFKSNYLTYGNNSGIYSNQLQRFLPLFNNLC